MKQITGAMLVFGVLVTSSFAQSSRGISGVENEVYDPDFSKTYQIQVEGSYGGGEGTPVIHDSWSGVSYFNERRFKEMGVNGSGYAFDPGQYRYQHETIYTPVNAQDGGAYDPTATQQNIHLSFLGHIDDHGYVTVTIYWWDEGTYFPNGFFPAAEELPSDEGNVYHSIELTFNDFNNDNQYESTFDNILPTNPTVMDSTDLFYDLFTFDTLIDANPQYMLVQFEIGHDEYAPQQPSTAYFTDVLFQQQSVVEGAVVPEPATCVLILLSLVGGFFAKKRS